MEVCGGVWRRGSRKGNRQKKANDQASFSLEDVKISVSEEKKNQSASIKKRKGPEMSTLLGEKRRPDERYQAISLSLVSLQRPDSKTVRLIQ